MTDFVPPLPNPLNITRKIRLCEGDAAAQLVLEAYAEQYLQAWIAAQPVVRYEARAACKVDSLPRWTNWFTIDKMKIVLCSPVGGYKIRALIGVEVKE